MKIPLKAMASALAAPRARAQRRYGASEKGKAAQRRYGASEKGKAAQRRYNLLNDARMDAEIDRDARRRKGYHL